MGMATTSNIRTLIKVLVAATLIGTILIVAGRSLFPAASTTEVFLGSAALLIALWALSGLFVVIVASINQAALRAGGTDTHWLWFKSDPPGLNKLRGRPEAPAKDKA
jgi:hypothetical protein